MENIQNKSALIPSDEIRSEELLAEQKFEAFITSLAHCCCTQQLFYLTAAI